MATIDIRRTVTLNAPSTPEPLQGTLYATENMAHRFIISARKDDEDAALSGAVAASFIRPDGETVIMSGAIEDGCAVVTLAQSCYTQTGRFTLTIFTIADGARTAVYCLTGNVRQTTTDAIVDPGHVVPDVADIIAEYAAMQQAVADAEAATQAAEAAAQHSVRYDAAQSLTTAQKAQARANIGLTFSDAGNGAIIAS